jgi:hypothetical protein
MASKDKGTAVAEQKVGALILTQDEMPDYLRDGEGKGNENVTLNDLVIPRLEIVQGLSPALKEGDPGYIESAKLGHLINSVTRENYEKVVYLVNVHFSLQYLVWKAREYKDPNGREVKTDGGFFGAFPTMEEAQARADQEGGADQGVEIIDTPQHVCLLVDPVTGDVQEIMVSMPRTKAKISRQWNSQIRLAGGDRFSRVWAVGSALESKNGNDYYNFTTKPAGYVSKELYERAAKLYDAISSGERRVVMDVTGMDDPSGAAPVKESGQF